MIRRSKSDARQRIRKRRTANLRVGRPAARRPFIELLESRQLLAGDLAITEFMASNVRTLADADGDYSDWIEIHNRGDEAVILRDWSLTDDPDELDQWHFPEVAVGADEFLVVFASGKDRSPNSVLLTGDFNAVADGEFFVDLPEGAYDVRMILGDVLRPRDNVAVSIQDQLVETVSTQAGEFATLGYSAEVNAESGGQLSVRLEDRGGQTARGAINMLAIASRNGEDVRRFDFGTSESPAEPGYTVVTSASAYEPEVGFGWQSNLVIFEADRSGGPAELHANFRLSAGGEYVALVSPTGQVVSEFGAAGTDYPEQDSDISTGITLQGTGQLWPPTPGEPNGDALVGVLGDLGFNVERGFYEAPFSLEITADNADVQIWYTTDGSLPAVDHGIVYEGPLMIDRTTMLRAAAFRRGYVSSKVSTHTFIFPGDVVLQNTMDKTITQDSEWGPQVVGSLLSIPTVSLVTSEAIPGDPLPTEIGVSMELMLPDGRAGFQVDAGMEHFGRASLGSPKKNIRLSFKAIYGPTRLDYDLFGEGATDSFDQLILRSGAHDSFLWTHPNGNEGIYVRNRWMSDRQLELGQPAPHGEFVHVYVNGTYSGMHHLMERPNAEFMASYFGGDGKDYDAVNAGTPIDGDRVAWDALVAATSDYDELQQYLDVGNYADYMLLQFYGGNDWDWSDFTNWMGARKRADGEGWKFFAWDSDMILRTGNSATVIDFGGPGNLWGQIKQHEEFRVLLADRAQQYFFDEGMLTPDRVIEQFDELAEGIRLPLIAETARWDRDYTPESWEAALDHLRNGHEAMLRVRTDIVIQQMRLGGVFPDIDAPTYLVGGTPQHGGIIDRTNAVELSTSEGVVYYTTDGSDPRLVGGAVSPTAIEATGPISLTEGATFNARALRDETWSALSAADFLLLSELPLAITEINYHPHDPNLVATLGEEEVAEEDFEFVELTNSGEQPVDLAGVSLVESEVDGTSEGIQFQFSSQTIAPGESIVVVGNRTAFESRYREDEKIAQGNHGAGGNDGEFGGSLSNLGEQLTLLDASGAIIQQFRYGSGDAWPARSDGRGSSLEVLDTEGDYSDATNWRSSSEFGGSPGWIGSGPDRRLVINEVLAHSEEAPNDQVELLNLTDTEIDITGWYVGNSDDDYFESRIDTPSSVPASGYGVLTEEQLGLDLNGEQGDQIWLIEADSEGRPIRFASHVSFDAMGIGDTVGRWLDGDPQSILFPMKESTFGEANSGPRTGSVIISEVHYLPFDFEPFTEDFGSATAGDIVPVLGIWDATSGRYVATPGGGGDLIAVVPDFAPLPSDFRFSATLNIPSETSFNQNGALIFDYQSPDDFKFASVHPGGGRWRIGQRDANGWNFLATRNESIAVDVDVNVTVDVAGSVITLRLGESEKLQYDFGTPLNSGHAGLGSRNGHVQFDDVRIDLLGRRDFGFLELVNTTPDAVNLDGWQLTGAVELDIPQGTTISAGESVVLVGIDPSSAKGSDFRSVYGVDESVTLIGPYVGELDGPGGMLSLKKPLESVGLDTRGQLVDRVVYENELPWPPEANGSGPSLHRVNREAFGAFPESWVAKLPSPGTSREPLAGDMDLDGNVDMDDIESLVLAVTHPGVYEERFGATGTFNGDTDQDGDLDFDDINGFVLLLKQLESTSLQLKLESTNGLAAESGPELPVGNLAQPSSADSVKATRELATDVVLSANSKRHDKTTLAVGSDVLSTTGANTIARPRNRSLSSVEDGAAFESSVETLLTDRQEWLFYQDDWSS